MARCNQNVTNPGYPYSGNPRVYRDPREKDDRPIELFHRVTESVLLMEIAGSPQSMLIFPFLLAVVPT